MVTLQLKTPLIGGKVTTAYIREASDTNDADWVCEETGRKNLSVLFVYEGKKIGRGQMKKLGMTDYQYISTIQKKTKSSDAQPIENSKDPIQPSNQTSADQQAEFDRIDAIFEDKIEMQFNNWKQ